MGFLSNIIGSNDDILFYVILGLLLLACSSKDFRFDSLFDDTSMLIFIAIIILLLFNGNKDDEREIE